MEEFIRGVGKDPEELTPIEVAEELTGLTLEELRKTGRYVRVKTSKDADEE